MKNSMTLLIIALCTIGFSAPCWADGHQQPQVSTALFVNVDSEPGKVVSAFHQALRSDDAKTARSLLADDVLIFEGGVERSAEEYANHHMLADISYLAAVKTTVLEQRVQQMGDLAVSISRSETVGNYRGKEIDNVGMETMVLRQHAGEWKISHIHWSH